MSKLIKKDPMVFAKEISNSNLVPQQFRGKPADIYLAMSWGDELGLSPIQSLISQWQKMPPSATRCHPIRLMMLMLGTR